jgi:hypothetical protein
VSARHRPNSFEPTSFEENRAHARAERQRIRAALRAGGTGVLDEVDLDALDEPGQAYRTPHHHWHEREASRRVKVWKLPFWKRRSAERHRRASTHPGD